MARPGTTSPTQSMRGRSGGKSPRASSSSDMAIVDGTLAAHTIADCPESKREHATKLCQASQPSVGVMLLDSCVFDVCFGGDQYAAEDGLAESQATS
mmetsp:Transcript_43374/g.139405  ORF Transcript_43374/g.139405 Transcript_43374/m.139405 type:complete len:97 (-) Transcript_43374:181-471(-)